MHLTYLSIQPNGKSIGVRTVSKLDRLPSVPHRRYVKKELPEINNNKMAHDALVTTFATVAHHCAPWRPSQPKSRKWSPTFGPFRKRSVGECANMKREEIAGPAQYHTQRANYGTTRPAHPKRTVSSISRSALRRSEGGDVRWDAIQQLRTPSWRALQCASASRQMRLRG